jgi:predicted RNA binding protein YcfA (HicA-like mRNA interferase family)
MDFSAKNLAKLLEERGWQLVRIKGSHHIYFNPSTNETMPVPIHGNKDLSKGTFFSILK